MNPIQFRLTAYTDPAGKRNDAAPKRGNEDDLFVDADLANGVQGEFFTDRVEQLGNLGALMVVADGMGGTNAGEVASAIAIETVKGFFAAERLAPDVVRSEATRRAYLERLVVEADRAIKSEAKRNSECEGMGSTIVLLWLYGNEASVAWCGDSRAYLYRESLGLRQITKDHSYVQELVDKGMITEEIAFDHPMNNIITRSLGDPGKQAQPDSTTIKVGKGDILMLCSDGLCGVLRDRKSYDLNGNPYSGFNMEDLIRANRGSMQQLREVLWTAAENSNWYDNVTVILCEILEGDEPAPLPEVNPMLGRTAEDAAPIQVKGSTRSRKMLWVGLLLSLVALLLSGYLLLRPSSVKQEVLPGEQDSLIAWADRWGFTEIAAQLRTLPAEEAQALLEQKALLLQEGKRYILAQLDTIALAQSTEEGIARVADLQTKTREAEQPIELYEVEQAIVNLFAEEPSTEEAAAPAPTSRPAATVGTRATPPAVVVPKPQAPSSEEPASESVQEERQPGPAKGVTGQETTESTPTPEPTPTPAPSEGDERKKSESEGGLTPVEESSTPQLIDPASESAEVEETASKQEKSVEAAEKK